MAARPAFAQSALRQVGFLHPGKIEPGDLRLSTFADGLRSKGFVEGKTVAVSMRAADFDPGRLAQYVGELVDSKVDVVFVVGSRAIQEARTRTQSLPIVALDLEADPVASVFVASRATGREPDRPVLRSRRIQRQVARADGRDRARAQARGGHVGPCDLGGAG